MDPICADKSNHGDDEDEGSVQPVDVMIPVLPRHGQVGDMRLL